MVVLFGEEARLAVVSTLHDVQRYAFKMDAESARHGQTLLQVVEESELGPLNPE